MTIPRGLAIGWISQALYSLVKPDLRRSGIWPSSPGNATAALEPTDVIENCALAIVCMCSTVRTERMVVFDTVATVPYRRYHATKKSSVS